MKIELTLSDGNLAPNRGGQRLNTGYIWVRIYDGTNEGWQRTKFKSFYNAVAAIRKTMIAEDKCAHCGHAKWRHANGRGRCGKQAHGHDSDCNCQRFSRKVE
jgi:hypothetical protein